MQTIDIHGIKVEIDPESDSAKYAADYLNKLSADEAKVFFDAAKRDEINGVAHFETPHDGPSDISHHLTLIHNNDGTYLLRRRTGY
jgi:hypothetical protein